MGAGAARLLTARRVTQDNQGKKMAGVDGSKSVPSSQRLEMAERIHPNRWKNKKKQIKLLLRPTGYAMRFMVYPVGERGSGSLMVKRHVRDEARVPLAQTVQ